MAIHKYEYMDKYLVLDVDSSNYYEVDEVVYNVLDYYPECGNGATIESLKTSYSEKDILNAIESIDCLIIQGKLFSKHYDRNVISYSDVSLKSVSIELHDKYSDKIMSLDEVKSCIDFLFSNSKDTDPVRVGFMIYNYQSCETLLNEAIKYTNEKAGITRKVSISVSTTEDIDSASFQIEGVSSYRFFLTDTINDMVVDKESTSITIDRNLLNFSEEIKRLVELGYRNIIIEPVHYESEEDYNFLVSQQDEIIKQFDKTVAYLKRNDIYDVGLFKLHDYRFENKFRCGAGCDHIFFDHDGNIYPCYHFAKDQRSMMGTVNEGISRYDIRQSFVNVSLTQNDKCRECWAQNYCANGCSFNSCFISNQPVELNDIDCTLRKRAIESSIYLKCSEQNK